MEEFCSKCEINDKVYYVIPLHEHPELIDQCCDLINLEWKRSHVARLRSLSGSSKNFPTSLLLVDHSVKPSVIGHCKLSKISHSSPVVFLESVVIHPNLRGIGLGKLLMKKTEEYLKFQKIDWIYLTTMDQQIFYEKLGYSLCEPISIYGGQFHPDIENNNIKLEMLNEPKIVQVCQKNVCNNESKLIAESKHSGLSVPSTTYFNSSLPPPVPPPLPSTLLFASNNRASVLSNKKVFMRKRELEFQEQRRTSGSPGTGHCYNE